MSKSNTLENNILKLIFQAIGIANIADNAASAPLTNLYWGAHTADPGDAGSQTTSECAYTNYARVAMARNNPGFVVVGNGVSPGANVDFPTAGAGSTETITHWSIGTASTGAGSILYSGPVTPNIGVVEGITPRYPLTSTITED